MSRSTDSSLVLRKRAQETIADSINGTAAIPNHNDALALLDELHAHQLQLEMQNEELRRVQADLEASRARYFDLYDLAPVGYVTVDEQGAIVESNLRAATLFGVTHRDLSRRNFSKFIESGDADVYHLTRQRLLKANAPQVCELKLIRANGSSFWSRLEMSLTLDGGAHLCRLVLIDISERKFAEQRFDAFMNHSPASASIVDEDGRYVYVNPAMQRYTGRALEAWQNKTFAEVWPPDVAQRLKQQHTRALVDNETTTEIETFPLGAQERVHQLLCFPFAGPNGKKMVGCVSVDITERHRLETALRDANVQLADEKKTAETATNAKSQFLSAMSHEIRTPLNGLIGMADLLLRTPLNTEQLSYARIVSDSAEALLELVNNVLDFSKIEAEKLELDETSFDLESLIEDTLSLMSFKARQKSLCLSASYKGGAPRYFFGDVGRIRQVLTNFIANAVKFTEAGHVQAEVAASTPVAGLSTVRLSIHDTGIGIPKEKLSHLFTRFGQADPTIARRFGGTGLGLFIVKRIVELMGGKVGVNSREGQGSTFYCEVTLRVDAARAEAAPPSEDSCLIGVPVIIAESQHIARPVVPEWCRNWGLNVEECDTSGLARTLAASTGRSAAGRIVLVEGNLEVLRHGVRDFRANASNAPLDKLVLISSDTWEKANELKADAILFTPVRAKLLLEKLTELVLGAPAAAAPARAIARQNRTAALRVLRPFKVLVIDDNLINQRLACALLSKMGCEVDTANDGVAAVKKVREKEYEILFMDCVMPEMDGFAATLAIRGLAGKYANIPIVALTASATSEDRDRCLEVGMDDFLAKPVRPEQLARCLTKWLK